MRSPRTRPPPSRPAAPPAPAVGGGGKERFTGSSASLTVTPLLQRGLRTERLSNLPYTTQRISGRTGLPVPGDGRQAPRPSCPSSHRLRRPRRSVLPAQWAESEQARGGGAVFINFLLRRVCSPSQSRQSCHPSTKQFCLGGTWRSGAVLLGRPNSAALLTAIRSGGVGRGRVRGRLCSRGEGHVGKDCCQPLSAPAPHTSQRTWGAARPEPPNLPIIWPRALRAATPGCVSLPVPTPCIPSLCS